MAGTFFQKHFSFNSYQSRASRAREGVRYQPWQSDNPAQNTNHRKRDRLSGLPQGLILPRRRPRKWKEILRTCVNKQIKKHVNKVIDMMEERFRHHRFNFKATQDVFALIWAQIFEEAIPMMEVKFYKVAALEGFLDVEMTDAPRLTDDDDDYIMAL